jgi:hypothetical protein
MEKNMHITEYIENCYFNNKKNNSLVYPFCIIPQEHHILIQTTINPIFHLKVNQKMTLAIFTLI